MAAEMRAGRYANIWLEDTWLLTTKGQLRSWLKRMLMRVKPVRSWVRSSCELG
jgi:hypothetical protein